jgi:glycosyltransferase involved in cell wall biosynthesis
VEVNREESGMSKIVIDAREYTTSTGRYVFRLVQYLEKIDTENDYIVLLKPKDMKVCPFSNPRFTKLASPYKEFTFQEQLGLWRQIRSLKPDLVHFGKDHQPILYAGKTVTTMHDLTTARFRNPDKQPLVFIFKQCVYKLVVKRVAHKSKRIIVPSQYVKDDIASYAHVSPEKISITYEAADLIPDTPEPVQAVAGKQFIMYVGRPTPHKNLWRLIKAFQLLKAQHPDLRLVLAGKLDSNYQQIAQKVADEQIANIIFTDFVSEGQLKWLYENCKAYVFPSLSEGFGLPPLEAMMHGAPVISSNATCLPEINGDAAHYFDPLNVQAMADAINEVLTDKDLRQKLIAAGHVQVAKYSWQRMAEQTFEIYRQVLGA